MFTLEVEYLLGRSFASGFAHRSAPEWPPHPGRVFSALAASYFESSRNGAEKSALEWLEAQGPPSVRAGEAGKPNAPVVFVPTNYQGDGPPLMRGKQPRFFPSQGPSEALVYFIWQESPEAEDAAALDRLASRTAYLGRACSLVRMRVAPFAPEPNYVPSQDRGRPLRIPSKGRLEELAKLYEAGLRPTQGAQQMYRKLGEPAAENFAESEFGMMAVFRKVRGPDLPIEASLTLTHAIRRAIMDRAGALGPLPETVHGHGAGSHCAIAALPFVAAEHADGHLMGFAIVFPRNTGIEDRMTILRACHALEDNGLFVPELKQSWTIEAEEDAAISQTLRPATWTRPSRIWKSVTPILLDRFPKKNGSSLEEIVANSCRRIGLPAPVRIEHRPFAKLKGVPPVGSFRLRRSREEQQRWGIHAELEFAEPVVGPVLLGAGRYFGLGLMRPEREPANGSA